MKRWISLLLVLVLCLSLCACGSAATPTEPPTEAPTEAPTEPQTEVREVPTEASAVASTEPPVQDYHEMMERGFAVGDYQVCDTKMVTYDERNHRYSTDFLPEELQAEKVEEVYYVLRIQNMDRTVGYYSGVIGKAAIKPRVKIKIEEVATGKVLLESGLFEGGDPPESITSNQSGRGKEPDEAEIQAWIDTAIVEILKNTPTELPVIEFNTDSLTDEEKATYEAKEMAERVHFSRAGLVEWLVEYENHTQEEAEAAADACETRWGVDWKEHALLKALKELADQPNYHGYYSYHYIIMYLSEICDFTQEEAVYAADNCGVDWKEQCCLQVKLYLEDDKTYNDTREWMVGYLKDYDLFADEEIEYALDQCGVK